MAQPQSEQIEMQPFTSDLMAELYQVLPRQWPIKEFVHLNLLEGFQHLPFPEAVASARRYRGASGYLPAARYRDLYRQGRITRADLTAVVDDSDALDPAAAVLESGLRTLLRRDLIIAAMLNPIAPLSQSQLAWQIDELGALTTLQPNVGSAERERLLTGFSNEVEAVGELWAASLARLGLQHYVLNAEELTDLSPEQAEQMLAEMVSDEAGVGAEQPLLHTLMRKHAAQRLDELLGQVGNGLTLRGLLLQLSGHDILEDIRPTLVRKLAAYLDQGLSAWPSDDRAEGFFALWRNSAAEDMGWLLEDLPEWRDELEMLPRDAVQTVVGELQRLGLAPERWHDYLLRLALELPGWSGMFLWRQRNPGYQGLEPARVEMMEYLAVRLVLERIFAQRLCRRLWRIEASLGMLRWYFRRRRSEFFVRYALHHEALPEYLVTLAQRGADRYAESGEEYDQWKRLADMVWTWQQSPQAESRNRYTVHRDGWRLFLMAQHLGLTAGEVRGLGKEALASLFAALALDEECTGYLWLQAFERNYREQVFNALVLNHGRGRWAERPVRPVAQVVFCMDDREEGFRRHLEEHNPGIETLGAAGFFGVPILWKGLDDERTSPLCPIVVTPSHEVHEVAAAGEEGLEREHVGRRSLRLRLKALLHQEVRRNLVSSAALIVASAPLLLPVLAGKVLAPRATGSVSATLRRRFERVVPTRVAITAERAAAALPQLGFSDEEQADHVQAFLRNIGLQSGFAPFVVMMGHGSSSENNPHLASYDCGACSGRHGGPNARVFAAMANRPEVRALLADRGVAIPEDTWFLGAFHNTCSEAIEWFDEALVPERLRESLARLREDIHAARLGSAHERCRRLPAAPQDPSPEEALRHVEERALDFSQARAEFGHANNAVAIIGRRAVSHGTFLDRRAFLISYDPTQDPEGRVVEALLLANGPVGAGINLDYYFSAADNDGYGSGSKVTHNVSGLLGVMHGTADDLRTGLPKQGIDYHEPMRLLVVVEAKSETLTAIYQRQPSLQELVGNGWLLLAAMDPDSTAIEMFHPQKGWRRWEGEVQSLAKVARSVDWYRGHREPLPMALIEQEEINRAG